MDTQGKHVVVAGGGPAALAKVRILLKTWANVAVYDANPLVDFGALAANRKILLLKRPIEPADIAGAMLAYAASGDAVEDARVATMARAAGVLVNTVDNIDACDFLTPAIVDRSPVTVAIGTEGTAPVLARLIKAEVEAILSPSLGVLAGIAGRFRPHAGTVPAGAPRRQFWQRFFRQDGAQALQSGGELAAEAALKSLLAEVQQRAVNHGHVQFVGAGPGDPELLTLKARHALDNADVVVYDRLVSPEIMELARREAVLIAVGKTPGGPSWKQNDINALLVEQAQMGHQIVRLKSGDPSMYGRLDEEIAALTKADIPFNIVPGITAAAAAAAAGGFSLTRRGRNKALRFLTAHDTDGFAEHEWHSLSLPGAAAAIYMGVRAATFLQGRLLMHGGDPATPMTVVENASRVNQKIVTATLGDLTTQMRAENVHGPAIIFLGLSATAAATALPTAAPPLSQSFVSPHSAVAATGA